MSAEKTISKIALYLNLVPVVLDIISRVERMITERGSGEKKKQLAMEILASVWEGAGWYGKVKELRGIPWQVVAPVASVLIDTLVAASNLVGRFAK